MNAFASRCGRLLRGVLAFALALAATAVIAGIALAWRLAQGPLDIDWAARRIEAHVNAPDAPTRIAIGRASIEWGGYAGGAGRGLELRLDDVRLTDRAGHGVAALQRLEISVAPSRLLLGQVAPRAVAVSGLELHLLRSAVGDVELDLAGTSLGDPAPTDATPPTITETMAELARPVRQDAPAARSPGLPHLDQLRRVHVTDSVLVMKDAALGVTARLAIGALDLRRPADGGLLGTGGATLSVGAARAVLSVQAEVAQGGGTQVQVAVAPVSAASVQQASPGLDGPTLLDASVQASATLLLSPALLPTGAVLHAEAGAGHAQVAGAPIAFDSLVLDTQATWDTPAWRRPDRLVLPRGRAVLRAPGGAWPSTLGLSGTVQAEGDGLAGRVTLTVDHMAFADLPSLWPEALGGHTRPWLTQNITAGTARDGSVTLGFQADADLRHPRLTTVDGTLTADDATIHWIRPVPPIEHAAAVLTIKSPEYLDIAVPSARQGALVIKDGDIRITGLNVKDQFLALSANIAGPVPDLITLLKHPGLRLLDRKPIPMRNPGGAMAGRLLIDFPLNHDLQFEQVQIDARARFTELRLGGLVAGRDLDRGDVLLEATAEQLKVSGKAAVGGIPGQITVEMDFRNGPPTQVVQRAEITAQATARQLAGAGLDPGSLVTGGTGQLTARYTERRDRTADLQVTADLRDAALAVAGWRKPAGPAAEASARLMLRADRLLGIEEVHAQGPGMAIDGRAQMVGDRPLLLALDRMVLGPTQASGTIRFPATPNEPIRAKLTGPVLDLSTQLGKPANAPTNAPKGGGGDGTPFVADIRFDKVLLANGRNLGLVAAHAEHDGKRLTSLNVESGGPERLEASIRPEGSGRRLILRAADGGALLRAMDLLDSVQGGRLSLNAVFDDTQPDAPLSGTAELANFHVQRAAALGKLLQAVTIYGLVDALNGQGIAFSELTLPFRWNGTALDVMEARAFSASLGVTAKGRVDSGRGVIDLQGTVVPAYVINSFLGRIPLLGRLFSAERGGGLVAVNYTMRGPLANPSVVVNPLSALTPGFLRGLFHILD